MKRKILLSPLIIIILIIVFGVGIAGAAIYLGSSGDANTQGINLQKGLVGHWKLDGNAKDSTPYANNGTVTGATLTTDRKSQANKAYSFDGTNDYISVASASNLNPTSAFTLEAWVKKSATKAQDIIFNDVHELKLDSNNKAVLRLLTGARLGTDMDMETAGVVNWDSFNSPATKEKNTTNPIQGTKDLHVIARDTATHDGVYQSLVSENKTYRVKVSYRVVSGSLNIQLGTSAEANTGLGNVGLGLTGSGTVVSYVLTTAGAWGLIMTTNYSGEFYVDDIEVKEVGATLTSSGAVSTNFDHIVATYDGSVSNIYINGVLDNSLTQAVTLSTDNLATLIGAGATGGTGYEQDFFNGSIDDVRVYNRALSATEVTALYQEYDPGIVISDLQKGLVGQWKLDGNAKDSTPYGNNGTVTEATLTTDRKGQVNKAYSFDGIDDYISVGTLAISTNGPATLSGWFYFTQDADAKDDYNNLFSRGTGISMLFQHPANNYFYTEGGYFDYVPPLNQWLHIALTYSGQTSTSLLYVNGVLKTINVQTESNITVFDKISSATGVDRKYAFSGYIDDVRVYNRALSATEITALYQEYDPGIVVSDLQKGLVGNWKMNSNAKDSTPYGNNGTVTEATLTTDRKGQTNKAYSFDGGNDIISVPDSDLWAFGSSNFSIGLWVKFNSIVNQESLIGQSQGGGAVPKWHFVHAADSNYAFDSSKTFFGYGSSGAVENKMVWNTSISAGNWYYMTLTKNGSIFTLYVNGISMGTNENANALLNVNSTIAIGSDGESWNFTNGAIDDVRIYNRALSQTEITALYESY